MENGNGREEFELDIVSPFPNYSVNRECHDVKCERKTQKERKKDKGSSETTIHLNSDVKIHGGRSISIRAMALTHSVYFGIMLVFWGVVPEKTFIIPQ